MNKRTRQLLAALLVLATVAGPIAGVAAAADTTRAADLVVRQESYVDEDVTRQQQNATSVYTVRGERITIKPRNFDPSNVVESGVDRGIGTLSFDEELGVYHFSSDGEEASFNLHWIVLEETEVAGSNATEIQRVRYEATIRVVGLANVDHVRPGTLAELREDGEKWRDWNDTLQDVREMDLLLWSFRGDPPDTETLLQGMVNTYVTTRDPFRLLTGGFFAVIITLTLTVGGLLWLAIREGLAAIAARRLRKQLNIYKATEAEEREVSERLLEIDRAETDRIWSNLDFNDFPGWPDHEADSYRDLGHTPRAAFERIVTDIMPPELQIRERLQALDQLGYVARVRERDEEGSVVDAELVKEDEFVFSEAEQVSIADPGDDLVEVLWNDQTLIDWNPVAADLDISEFETDPVTFSLDEALDAIDLQVDRFEDEKAAAKLLQDHIEWAAKSEYTDDLGTPKTSMRVLNSFLETSTWLRDVHGIPSARILVDHLERAILDYDPGKEAEEFADTVREGGA